MIPIRRLLMLLLGSISDNRADDETHPRTPPLALTTFFLNFASHKIIAAEKPACGEKQPPDQRLRLETL